jgi:hypothetical protein
MPKQTVTFTVNAESEADLKLREEAIKDSVLLVMPWVDRKALKIKFEKKASAEKLHATAASEWKVVITIEQSKPIPVSKAQLEAVFANSQECDSTFLGDLNVTKIEVGETEVIKEPPATPGASAGGKTAAEYRDEISDLESQLEDQKKKTDDEKKKKESWMIVGIIFIILFGLAVIGIAALIVLRGGSSSKAVSPA